MLSINVLLVNSSGLTINTNFNFLLLTLGKEALLHSHPPHNHQSIKMKEKRKFCTLTSLLGEVVLRQLRKQEHWRNSPQVTSFCLKAAHEKHKPQKSYYTFCSAFYIHICATTKNHNAIKHMWGQVSLMKIKTAPNST